MKLTQTNFGNYIIKTTPIINICEHYGISVTRWTYNVSEICDTISFHFKYEHTNYKDVIEMSVDSFFYGSFDNFRDRGIQELCKLIDRSWQIYLQHGGEQHMLVVHLQSVTPAVYETPGRSTDNNIQYGRR